MSLTKPAPKAGDPCPNCGDEFVAHRAPTDAEFAAFSDRENPRALPPRVDTAPAAVRAELGTLYECRNPDCRYRTRIPAGPDAPAESGKPAAPSAPAASAPAPGAPSGNAPAPWSGEGGGASGEAGAR